MVHERIHVSNKPCVGFIAGRWRTIESGIICPAPIPACGPSCASSQVLQAAGCCPCSQEDLTSCCIVLVAAQANGKEDGASRRSSGGGEKKHKRFDSEGMSINGIFHTANESLGAYQDSIPACTCRSRRVSSCQRCPERRFDANPDSIGTELGPVGDVGIQSLAISSSCTIIAHRC